MSAPDLRCPGCDRHYPAEERFCDACGMPLVAAAAGEEEPDERRRRARKIRPEYAQGPLVKVGRASNLAEMEMIEGLLLEHGIPSIGRSSGNLDVPDFYLGGRRDILVPESGAQAAREALAPARPAEAEAEGA